MILLNASDRQNISKLRERRAILQLVLDEEPADDWVGPLFRELSVRLTQNEMDEIDKEIDRLREADQDA